jgi:hypothetical protein
MKNDDEALTDKQFGVAILVCGVIGALIGFGIYGTLQTACLGAGIGALTPLAVLIFSSF